MPPRLDLAFVTRPPNKAEVEQLRLVLSTFCDGSGMNKGGHLPGWRDVERTVAAVFHGKGSENKGVFDVAVSPSGFSFDIGLSVKCKNLSGASAMKALAAQGRGYMELANSPAKFWAALKSKKLDETHFKKKKNAALFGEVLIDTVHSWHTAASVEHKKLTTRDLNIDKSVFLTLSDGMADKQHVYQWHSFPLEFPKGIKWKFRSEKSLCGYDPVYPNEVLFDWYGLSGGQLKYYPRASEALFSSDLFTLEKPPIVSLLDKAATYFPAAWAKTNID